jgi:hypothetical protein
LLRWCISGGLKIVFNLSVTNFSRHLPGMDRRLIPL